MEFSPAQKNAIYTGGASLLVSAAAGSGKTAVLVERVIQKVLAGGDISRLWIMTFTDAAASEMRQKIEQAVENCLEADPENEHLQQQMLLVSADNISTIHSVCKRIIDQNFQKLGLDPGTAIGEESVLEILFDRLLEDFVEELYRRAREEEEIAELIAFFSSGRNDERLLGVLKKAYRLYEEQPFPQTEFPVPTDIFEVLPDDMLYRQALSKMTEAMDQYTLILGDPAFDGVTDTPLWQSMQQERDSLALAIEALGKRDFNAAGSAIRSITFATWNTRAKLFDDYRDLLPLPQSCRGYAKELIQSLQQETFHKTAEQHMADIARTSRILGLLFSCAVTLDERFTVAKRDRSIISFSDMERLALNLLVTDYDPQTDRLKLTDVALEMREEIDEIIVDEYQDTNRKQDLIFRALSKDESNMFMVGDVKQSIYRFRAACPELFLEKKRHAAPAEEREITRPSYLYLNQNFRSHPDILRFANQIFRVAMSSRLGQIEYDETEQLNTGGLYVPESQGRVELTVMMEQEDSSDEFAELTGMEQQADYVADKIRSLLGTSFYDVKKKAFRPLKYGDMAVLCRVAKNTAVHFENALQRRGIHCINNNQDQQFLDLWEIKMLRAYLQVISNPYRDIPLVTLLYSDFYCFTAKELAQIRAADRHAPFYDALQKRAGENEACARFLEDVDALRRAAVGKRSDEVLQMIFARTHILDRIASYPDGGARVANMQMLLRYAVDYEKESYKGLFSFLNYLDKLSALGQILPGARSGDDAEECVQVLSVHKSKGLEYPVCFLVGLDKGIRDKDSDVLISNNELGFAVKMRDDDSFTEYPSLPYLMLKEANHRDALSEEMRILYVALTRPKTHLYLVCAEERAKLKKMLEQVVTYHGTQPSEFLSTSPSTLKWLLFALRDQQGMQSLYDELEIDYTAAKRDCDFGVSLCAELADGPQRKGGASSAAFDPEEAMRLALAQYPFAAQTKLPIKLSVSEVKGMREQDPEAMLLIPESFGRRQPSFLSGKTMGNVVGNAVHKFMQFADFGTLARPDGVATEKKRLLEQGFLTEKELDMVEEAPVLRFVAQPLFQQMISADSLEKEKRFFFTLAANRIFNGCEDDSPVLLQGVLDCCFEKDGQTVIVDYKTDRLKEASQFAERYGLQLRLYRYGLRKLTGKKADKLYIYSFHLDEVIEIS